MDRPLLVTAIAFLAIFFIFSAFGRSEQKSELFLDLEPDQLFVLVQAQGSLSAAEEFALTSRAEQAIMHLEGIEGYTLRSGSESGGFNPVDGLNGVPNDTVGQILVDLKANDGINDGRKNMAAVEAALEKVQGLRFEVRQLEQGPPGTKDVDMIVASDNDLSLIHI